MKILITGGHLGPAMAVIEEIGNKSQIVYVGRKYDLDREKTFSLEYQEITKKKIPFYHLQTGRLTRLFNLGLIINIFKIPLGLFQAVTILAREKPDLILSFGGYIAFPICLVGFGLRIPIFIHEQTLKPGLTNRITGFLAKKIFVAFGDAKKYFPAAKVILSGNPIRKTILTIHKKPFALKKNLPVIYFTGGSLGSHEVNLHVEKILPQILAKYIVIHQTGKIKQYNDLQRLSEKRSKWTKVLKDNYYLRGHFLADELGYIYSKADLVVGRSGANTFFELIAAKIPAIFIPLPWSASQEQLKHAQLFQKAGVGEIFHQSQDSKHLVNLIEKVINNIHQYKNNFKNVEPGTELYLVELLCKENAAKIIVEKIFSQISA